MEVQKSKNFIKHFNKRVLAGSPLEKKFQERLALFLGQRSTPILRDHKLSGNLRAFWITGDVRVIYYLESADIAVFVDIGTHPQVYGK